MKSSPTDQKLRGGYYTPKLIADFLAHWAIRSPADRVLEPSCGDGIVLESAAQILKQLGAREESIASLVQGVEIEPEESIKARQRLRELGIPELQGQIHTGDFFEFCKSNLLSDYILHNLPPNSDRFDVAIGNPPFIRYQNFPEGHRNIAFTFMKQAGFSPNRLTNAWLPFLVVSTLLLKDTGRLAMVIPAELLQVNYAAEARRFLGEFFGRITLITFRELLFSAIQQEVVLFLAERGGVSVGVRAIELDNMDDLSSYEHAEFLASDLKPMDHSTEKWTQYFLDTKEITLLRSLRKSGLLRPASDVIDVDIGVVSGENKYFVLTEKQLRQYGLKAYSKRIVSRSAHLQGLVFSEEDWRANSTNGFPSYLFMAPDKSSEQLPKPVRNYVLEGEEDGVHKGFKCRVRPRWYVVPSVWVPGGFMLRQVHGYPKIVVNEAKAICTDTIHRVRFREGTSAATVAAAFLNSLTFAFSEVTGRSYGGGVLTFEPSESERLPIPVKNAEALDVEKIDKLLRKGNIDSILDITDRVLLTDGLGLSSDDAKCLRGIWRKLRDRRINRTHNRQRGVA